MQQQFGILGTVWLLATVPAIATPGVTPSSETEILQALRELPGWRRQQARIDCTYQFTTFVEAVRFINRLVEPAEAAAHHPDITLNYNRLTLSLTTHDAGGLTSQDFTLAQTISQLAANESTPLTCQGDR